MTVIIHPKKYLSFEQLKDRWKCSEDDLRYLIVNKDIKPSIVPSGHTFEVDWEECEDGTHYRCVEQIDEQGLHKTLSDGTWVFLQRPITKGAHDCVFHYASTTRNPSIPPIPFGAGEEEEGDQWYEIEKGVSIGEVMRYGAFMMTEIERYELNIKKKGDPEGTAGKEKAEPHESRPEKSLSTKERTTLLKILVGIAKAKFQFDPTDTRSKTSGDISKTLELQGIKVDPDTIRRYLKEAVVNGLDKANSP